MTYQVYPLEETIRRFRTPLTQGENQLLLHLKELFNSKNYHHRNFEIYVQPNLFFGKPDFIIIEPGYSIWIIEVKDYNPRSYEISIKNNQDKWILCDGTPIPSPISQVDNYKNKFLDYSGPNLYESVHNHETFRNKFGLMIRTAVFLPFYSTDDIQNKIRFTNIFTGDSIKNKEDMTCWSAYFNQIRLNEYRLNEESYQEIISIINPGENGENYPLPEFTLKKYRQLSQSIARQQKIKGIAGTGKTSVLAKRAVSCSERLVDSGEEILVSYFNITMGNYLHDKIIAEGKGKTLNELGIQIVHFHSLYEWGKSNEEFFVKGKMFNKTYGALFIDEGQDLKKEWFDLLKQDYLKENKNEFVIFADENQNIYNRFTIEEEDELEDKILLPVTPILGRWNLLNTVYRVKNDELFILLKAFSKDILGNQKVKSQLQISLFSNPYISSIFYQDLSRDKFDSNIVSKSVTNHIRYLTQTKEISINDIAIISNNKKNLKIIEHVLRGRGGVFSETLTTFKPSNNKEEVDRGNDENVERKEDRPYKIRFFRNNGSIKFSTIHSFKGWETPYVILLLTPQNSKEEKNIKDYLIYTGLSRAKKGLLIINYDQEYSEFFKENIYSTVT